MYSIIGSKTEILKTPRFLGIWNKYSGYVMKFGYARVSKSQQSLDIQIKNLKKAGCDEIYQEKSSGANDSREQLNTLISKLRDGDIVCVTRLDRLGRRMIKLVSLINDFYSKGVQFVSLENNIDTTTPMGMLLFNMCAAFSEMERELLRERVIAGLESAKEKGRKGGRPKSLTASEADKVMALKKSGEFSVKQIISMMKISKSVYYRTINESEDMSDGR
ncbi:MAG: DNA invertase Pin-like site-specific DNA recombinase [Francisellaceae bacterium]